MVDGLAIDRRNIQVRATDSLSLPLGKTPESLTQDLDVISQTLLLNPKPELQILEQLKRVKSKETIKLLDDKLRAQLRASIKGSSGDDELALGWPFERVDEYGTPSSFKLIGTGNRRTDIADDLPTLEALVEAITTKNPDDPLKAAKSIKVMLFRDSYGDEPVSPAIPVVNWLYYEVDLDNIRYCLFDSKWYAMDTDYADRLEGLVNEIFDREASVSLPDWNVADYPDEFAYNDMVATELEGVNLDRRLLRTEQHPRGFEACDIITSKGDLIHVKHIKKSALASHLIAQATVATEALRYDNQARQKLRELVVEAGGEKEWVADRLGSVILGIARERRVTATSLFSFTQVTLARLYHSLEASGVQFSVVPIKRY